MAERKTSPAVDAELTGSLLRVCIEDPVSTTHEVFAGLSAAERKALAAEAWAVGLRAVAQEREARELREEPADVGQRPIRLSTLPPSGW
jgi:hypothetical protein